MEITQPNGIFQFPEELQEILGVSRPTIYNLLKKKEFRWIQLDGRKYWYISNNKAVIWALNKERLINNGYYDLATAYQSVHVNY